MYSKPFGSVVIAAGNVEELLDDADDFAHRGTTGRAESLLTRSLMALSSASLSTPLPARVTAKNDECYGRPFSRINFR
ncbi:hypothetical protein PP713_09460 [Mycobacterium sp. CSUR Q5927]|nr:hypothetical protein [Mycobacterium sp. CSUR Q5927]